MICDCPHCGLPERVCWCEPCECFGLPERLCECYGAPSAEEEEACIAFLERMADDRGT